MFRIFRFYPPEIRTCLCNCLQDNQYVQKKKCGQPLIVLILIRFLQGIFDDVAFFFVFLNLREPLSLPKPNVFLTKHFFAFAVMLAVIYLYATGFVRLFFSER